MAFAGKEQQAKLLQSHLQLAYFNYLQMLPQFLGSENINGNLAKKVPETKNEPIGSPKHLNLNLNLNLGLNNLNLNMINPNRTTNHASVNEGRALFGTLSPQNAAVKSPLTSMGSGFRPHGDSLDLIANVVVNESLKKERKGVAKTTVIKTEDDVNVKQPAKSVGTKPAAKDDSSSSLGTESDRDSSSSSELNFSRHSRKSKLGTLVKRSRSQGPGRPKQGPKTKLKGKLKSSKSRSKIGAKRSRKQKKFASDPLPMGTSFVQPQQQQDELQRHGLEYDRMKEEFPKKKRSRQQSSKYRGVSRCKKDGRFQARIRVGSSVKYLGRFKTELEAAMCYDVAAVHYHGVKAVPNFPKQKEACT